MSITVSNRRTLFWVIAISVLAVILAIWWMFSQPGTAELVGSSINVLKQQPWLYALILMLVTAFMLPPFVVIIMGGFLFGSIQGALISSVAYLIGSIASFYIGRYFAQDSIARMAKRRPAIHALNVAVERKGLLVVLLSRLALVLPYNLLNVVLGASRVSLKHYVIGTWIGTLPVMIGNSILGETAPGLLDIMRGEIKLAVNSYVVAGFGIGMISLLVLLVRWSGKQLQHEIDAQNIE